MKGKEYISFEDFTTKDPRFDSFTGYEKLVIFELNKIFIDLKQNGYRINPRDDGKLAIKRMSSKERNLVTFSPGNPIDIEIIHAERKSKHIKIETDDTELPEKLEEVRDMVNQLLKTFFDDDEYWF